MTTYAPITMSRHRGAARSGRRRFGGRALSRRATLDGRRISRRIDGRAYRRIERKPPGEALALIRLLAARFIPPLLLSRTAAMTETIAKADALHLARTALGPVEYADSGSGPALLALHGGMGGYDQSLLLARALLASPESYRVVALSRPGYLGTPRPKESSFADQADLYAALLDHLGIERAVVAAISAGGPSAIEFAARRPDRCAGLILVSAASGPMKTPEAALKGLRRFEAVLRLPGLLRLSRWLSLRDPERTASRSIRDPLTRRRTLAHPEAGPLLAALSRSVFERTAERLPGTKADIEALIDLPPTPFERVRAPTLVVHGEIDAIVPFAHGARSAREIAGAEFLALSGGEHVCLFTDLDEARLYASRFLETCRWAS